MSVVHQAPSFRMSETLDALSDSADIDHPAVGIMNLDTSTTHIVKVNYVLREDTEIGTLCLAPGQVVFAPIRRVRDTDTTALAADIELLFG